MALAVRTFTVDPLKQEDRRDRPDAGTAKAFFDIKVINGADLTGVIVTLQSPVPAAAPIVLTAGTEFPATAATQADLARALIAAIDRTAVRLLHNEDGPVVDSYKTPFTGASAEPGARVRVGSPGAWGENVTLTTNATANSANLEINGTAAAGGTTQNAVGGAGPKGTQALEDFLATLTPPTQPTSPPDLVSVSQSSLPSGEVHYTVVYDTA